MARVDIQEKARRIRAEAEAAGKDLVPEVLQRVTKKRIRQVLRAMDLETADNVDAVFALLDNTQPSWFSKPPQGARFSDGATVAHIGAHIGILQRGSTIKLDREGRDYWIKPLREVGAIEPIYLDPKSGSFLPGHPKAKSPNSAYRLTNDFAEVLRARKNRWHDLLKAWMSEDAVRRRIEIQARLASEAQNLVERSHVDLIHSCIRNYVPLYLPGYEVLFIDDSDGVRISEKESKKMKGAGLELRLGDSVPDVLLWNRKKESLWVIEAVTSDGEVDTHKVERLREFAARYGKRSIGFTTAYPTWKLAASRQKANKNIAPGTYVWIEEDPTKHFLAESFLKEE
jgi:hypothetical protein